MCVCVCVCVCVTVASSDIVTIWLWVTSGYREINIQCCWELSGKTSFHSFRRSGYEKTLTPLGTNPASILYKSTAGRYRPVSYPDGPITARYRFIKNAYWEDLWQKTEDVACWSEHFWDGSWQVSAEVWDCEWDKGPSFFPSLSLLPNRPPPPPPPPPPHTHHPGIQITVEAPWFSPAKEGKNGSHHENIPI